MANKQLKPELTPGNKIYLYRLLSQELGCGKQTFITRVDEALEADGLDVELMGFSNSRELLEQLDEFLKLTVFKGGRVYATVIELPEWDAALAAADKKQPAAAKATKGNKPWKKKKGERALKPARPKMMKRPEPEPVPAPEPASAAAPESGPQHSMDASIEAVELAVEHVPAAEPAAEVIPNETAEIEATDDQHEAAAPEPATTALPQPAITFTVTYDPYSGIDRETKLESNPLLANAPTTPLAAPMVKLEAPVEPSVSSEAIADPEPAPPASGAQAKPVAVEAAAVPAPQATIEPAPAAKPAEDLPSKEALAGYPVDFSAEVYPTSETIAELCELLPYGTDVFTLLAEDWARALQLELVRGTRARATFPLRIQHLDSTDPLAVTLKMRSGLGLKWELSQVE